MEKIYYAKNTNCTNYTEPNYLLLISPWQFSVSLKKGSEQFSLHVCKGRVAIWTQAAWLHALDHTTTLIQKDLFSTLENRIGPLSMINMFPVVLEELVICSDLVTIPFVVFIKSKLSLITIIDTPSEKCTVPTWKAIVYKTAWLSKYLWYLTSFLHN